MTSVRESPARDVGELLADTAGLWKLRKGAIANDVVLRGLQSRDLNVLIDHLEEEHGTDTDYFINATTIDQLVGLGASTALVTLLRSAVGDTDGIEVGWEE